MNSFLFFKGRVAFYCLLKAFGIGPGDRVLLPGYTCVVVPSAVRYTGAIPEYADIDEASYNALLPDYERAYARLSADRAARQVNAVVIQHTYGNPNRDSAAIAAWARQRAMRVIEDCAHCNGVSVQGRFAGDFGDAAFFSFQWSKPFTTGLGGEAILPTAEHHVEMQELERQAANPGWRESLTLATQVAAHTFLMGRRSYWTAIRIHRKLSKANVFIGSSTNEELQGEMPPGYLKRMGKLQRWLLERRRAPMPAINLQRQRLAQFYDRLLAARGIPPFAYEPGAVLIRYPLRARDRAACLSAAREARIELGDWFDHPLHPSGSRLEGLNWNDALCPTAAKLARTTINLPVHGGIGTEEAERVVQFVADWIDKSDR
jgi:dTDP-4-amino-4,6-dideoxygalactose transaminase